MSFKLHIVVISVITLLCKGIVAVDYYPGGYFDSEDVSKITWAHAVNSQAELTANLGNSVQMLEADIVLGKLKGTNVTTAIMAHPPSNESDLSFEMFLNQTIEYNKNRTVEERKGIKLDFKDFGAANISIPMLKDLDSELIQFPIWINADILPGPVNASQNKVEGKDLIKLQKDNAPNSTLSIGWTTNFGAEDTFKDQSYTKEQLDQMANLIKEEFPSSQATPKVEITFPLRAGLALNSIENLKILLDGSGINHTSPSITLWEGSADPRIEMDELNSFIKEIHASRVFVDLPNSLKDAGWSVKSESTLVAVMLGVLFGRLLF